MRRASSAILAGFAIGGVGAWLLSQRPPLPAPSPDGEPAAARAEAEEAAHALARAGADSPLGVTAADAPAESWAPDQVLIAPADPAALEELAARWGAEILRPVRRSGLAVLSVPAGSTPEAFLGALQAEGSIRSGSRHGTIQGAAMSGSPSNYQWHRKAVVTPSSTSGLSGVVVAVLDTGVAYESYADAGGTYVQAPSLAGSPIVAPWDFVNGDAHANDDHQHGTHIASLIGSNGSVLGVAPGVALMPLKVLDRNNKGYEIDLIEALYHAVDHGADVVNMSLSFGRGYVPSPALLAALEEARAAGLVLVGAAGNAGSDEVTWPARSPHVISVGATCMKSATTYDMPAYSNYGTSLDILAPGGCLDRDANLDGLPDGLIAESIAPQDPSKTGYWAWAGTSQAAAVTSGAVAHALAKGADPGSLARYLHLGASSVVGSAGFKDGRGAGRLRIDRTLYYVSLQPVLGTYMQSDFGASVLPFLASNGDGTVTPSALVTVQPPSWYVWSAEVYGRLYGAQDEKLACTTSAATGWRCVLRGKPVKAVDAAGQPAALAWRFAVDAVVVGNLVAARPQRMLYASPELDAVVAGLQGDPELADAALAFHWEETEDLDLGPLAEAYTVLDSGSGIATSPLGLLFTPPLIAPLADVRQGSLDGTGIATSPLGFRLVDLSLLPSVDGTGIATSPLGVTLVTFDGSLRKKKKDCEDDDWGDDDWGDDDDDDNSGPGSCDDFDGSGIATSPFGALTVVSPLPSTCLAGCAFSSEPIMLGSGLIGGEPAELWADTALGAQIADGGWVSADGYQLASAMASTSAFSQVSPSLSGSSAGLGAVQVQ